MKKIPTDIEGQFVINGDDLTKKTGLEWIQFLKLPAVYEVIRLMDGVALFLEDHLKRLENSLRLMDVNNTLNSEQLAQSIHRLSIENELPVGNVKIVFALPAMAPSEKPGQIRMFFIPHHYPDREAYAKGYRLQTIVLERPEPNAKSVNPSLNKTAAALKSKTGIDEALLVTHEGLVSEGSKSNIFFVRDEQVLTPPRQMVLPGITRQKVIAICRAMEIEWIETKIPLNEISQMSGAFISGTSPKVMPVRSIDDHKLNPAHPLILKIMAEYDRIIDDYIQKHPGNKA